MSIPVQVSIGAIIKNTNGTPFKIIETARPGSNPPIVAEDTTTGEIQYFNSDGSPDNFLHAALVLSIDQIPVNDMNSNINITPGVIYIDRNGDQVRCDGPAFGFIGIVYQQIPNKFVMRHVNNLFDVLGYQVWSTGMVNNDASPSPDDVRDTISNPLAISGYVYVDESNPGTPIEITKSTSTTSTSIVGFGMLTSSPLTVPLVARAGTNSNTISLQFGSGALRDNIAANTASVSITSDTGLEITVNVGAIPGSLPQTDNVIITNHWGILMSSPPSLSQTPSGSMLMATYLRQRTTDTETFKLFNDTK